MESAGDTGDTDEASLTSARNCTVKLVPRLSKQREILIPRTKGQSNSSGVSQYAGATETQMPSDETAVQVCTQKIDGLSPR